MRVGLLGFGNVAAATVQKFTTNHALIASKLDAPIQFVKIATRTTARAVGHVPAGCVLTSDCWEVVNDPHIEVVVELIGGTELAKELVLRAIHNGKHVVTANKALLAHHGEEILKLAEQKRVSVLFEGAVAVSIPIIKTLKESAAANNLTSITGILNGTSNYILSQMGEHGAEFSGALAQAQQKGYAEADPTLDINGEDAAHKITILASLAFGVPLNFAAVHFKGINEVQRIDLAFAKRLGFELKLIAQAQLNQNKIFIAVAPLMVPVASMLSSVRGSMNGIALVGDLFGSAFFYGSGAGGTQTASAVLADLMDLAQGSKNGPYVGTHNLGFKPSAITARQYLDSDERCSQFYLRIRVQDKVGVLARLSAIFANADVSVSSLLQDVAQDGMTDLIATTHSISASKLQSILPALQEAAAVQQPVVVYPVLG